MLTFPPIVVPSVKSSPIKSFYHFDSNHRRSSKDTILIAGVRSKSHLDESSRRLKNMVRLARAQIFVIHGVKRGGVGETELITQSKSSDLRKGVDWRDVEGFLNRMSKWLVACLFGLLILWEHDAEALWVAMGSVVNSYLSMRLKKILNQERPVSGLRPDPGMPSSHAQSIFYAETFVVFSLVRYLGINILSMAIGTGSFLAATYFTWLRVSQRLHTVSQVLVGAVLGSAFCITWLWLWHSFVLNAFTSSIWVQIIVVLVTIAFCSAFMVYVVRNWLQDEY